MSLKGLPSGCLCCSMNGYRRPALLDVSPSCVAMVNCIEGVGGSDIEMDCCVPYGPDLVGSGGPGVGTELEESSCVGTGA